MDAYTAGYAKQPLSALRSGAGCGPCAQPMPCAAPPPPCENPHKVVRSDCHQDCITHCTFETKTPLKCNQPCASTVAVVPAGTPVVAATATGVMPVAVATPGATVVAGAVATSGGYGMGWGCGALIIWFIIIFVIAWLILFATKPNWVLRHPEADRTGGSWDNNREVDTGRIVIAAILIALIIVIITFIIAAVCRRYM